MILLPEMASRLTGTKVANFTQQRGNQLAFLTSVVVGEGQEDADFYATKLKE